jgi:hypothetical protein
MSFFIRVAVTVAAALSLGSSSAQARFVMASDLPYLFHLWAPVFNHPLLRGTTSQQTARFPRSSSRELRLVDSCEVGDENFGWARSDRDVGETPNRATPSQRLLRITAVCKTNDTIQK